MNGGVRRSVLVVDDDPSLRDLVEMILGEEGYEVVAAADGQEALAQVERSLPGVILLDMKMPVMDGYEFARRFRARFGDAVPIVALTAAENPALCAEEIGARAWLAKPFEIQDLIDVVAGLGSRSEREDAT